MNYKTRLSLHCYLYHVMKYYKYTSWQNTSTYLFICGLFSDVQSSSVMVASHARTIYWRIINWHGSGRSRSWGSRIAQALPWTLAEQEAAQHSALFNACCYFRRYIPSVCTHVFLDLPFGYFNWDIVVENTRIYEFAISQRWRFMCLSSGLHQRVGG